MIFSQVSIAPLVSFRILFGALMAIGMTRFWVLGWVDRLFVEPDHFFKFTGFEWVTVPTAGWVYLINGVAILSAVFISIGLFYRLSAVIFFLCFSYIELMDASNYLNHYYLVALFAFILLFLPANRMHSFDLKLGRVRPLTKVPAITINILIAQMVIVYTFAGLAKVNYDWLFRAMPLSVWLPEHTDIPLIGPLLGMRETAFVFSWIGALYDLSIGYFMLFRKTRPVAYLFVIVFHVLTGTLFNIGLFPVIMIFCTTTFFSSETHLKWHKRFGLNTTGSPSEISYRSYVKPLVLFYLIVQILVPLRHLLYPGNVLMTEEGYRFSWRVMLVEKAGTALFSIVDKKDGRKAEIINSRYLTDFQEKQMAIQPDFMLQYARIIADDYRDKIVDPAVYVNAYVTLNGRVSTQYIDPETDLLSVKNNWKPRKWVIAKEIQGF